MVESRAECHPEQAALKSKTFICGTLSLTLPWPARVYRDATAANHGSSVEAGLGRGQRAGTPFPAFAPARSSPERRMLTDMCMEAVEAPAARTTCQVAGTEAGRVPWRARELPPQAMAASRAPRPRARNAAR